jgi:hypothetical protein
VCKGGEDVESFEHSACDEDRVAVDMNAILM